MVINIKGRNIDINPEIHSFINKKIQKLISDLKHPVECNVILEQERNRIKTEIILSGDHGKFYFKKFANDIYSSVEQAVHAADLSIKKFKEKQRERRKRTGLEIKSYSSYPRVSIIDYNKIEILPMSYEEVYLQMKYLKKRFMFFIDLTNDKISVMYREGDKIILLRTISKIKKILGLKKYRIESFYVIYKKNKIKLKKNKDFKITEEEDIEKVIENLNEKNKYIVLWHPDEKRFYFFVWLKPNKIGRCVL